MPYKHTVKIRIFSRMYKSRVANLSFSKFPLTVDDKFVLVFPFRKIDDSVEVVFAYEITQEKLLLQSHQSPAPNLHVAFRSRRVIQFRR